MQAELIENTNLTAPIEPTLTSLLAQSAPAQTTYKRQFSYRIN